MCRCRVRGLLWAAGLALALAGGVPAGAAPGRGAGGHHSAGAHVRPDWGAVASGALVVPAQPGVLPPAPGLPGVSVYPSAPWVGGALQSYFQTRVPAPQPAAPAGAWNEHGHGRPCFGTGVLVPDVIVLSPDASILAAPPATAVLPSDVSSAPAAVVPSGALLPPPTAGADALAAALRGIERAWMARRAADLAAYLPDAGGILLLDGGRPRTVGADDFLGAAALAMQQGTPVAYQFQRTVAVGELMSCAATRAYRDAAGGLHASTVSYLLRPQGARWAIVAADIAGS